MSLLLSVLLACGPPAAAPADDTATETDSAPPCPDGQLLDGATCVPEDCGVGPWGDLAVDEATVYVQAGGEGDGSAASPLGSILAGADLAGERGGGLVAIAAGTYAENVVLGRPHDGVTLAGRCAELVTVDGSTTEETPALYVGGDARRPAVEAAGLTFRGGYVGLWADRASLTARGVVVVGNEAIGVYAQADAVVVLEDVVVTGTTPIRGAFGRGVDVEDGAQLTATGCTLADNTEIGVYAAGDGTEVTLSDCTVRGTRSRSDGAAGNAVQVDDRASFTADRSTFTANHEVGVRVDGEGASARLVDCVIEATAPDDDGVGGRGAQVADGGHLTLTGSTVHANAEVGVAVIGEGSVVDLVDSVISGTGPDASGEGGYGLAVERGATATLTGSLVDDNTGVAITVLGADTHLRIDGSTVGRTRTDADGAFGHGIEVTEGATLEMSGSTVTGCTGLGVGASGADTSVVLTGGSVDATGAGSDDESGVAVGAFDGAVLSASGVAIIDTVGVGVLARDAGTSVTLATCTITGTRAPPTLGARGLEIAYGATLAATGCTVDGTEGVGVLASHPATRVTLSDTTVSGTRRPRDAGSAMGVVAQATVVLHAVDGTIEGTEGPGLYVATAVTSVESYEIARNGFAGVVVLSYSDVEVERTVITDNQPDAELGGGFGVYARNDGSAPRVAVSDSTIGPHRYAAVWLDGPGSYALVANDLSGGPGFALGGASVHGNAVFAWNGVTAWDGSTGLYLADNGLHDGENVALLLHGANAVLDGNEWTTNGVDVLQQACGGAASLTASDLAGVPSAAVCPDGNVLVDTSIAFETVYLPEAGIDE